MNINSRKLKAKNRSEMKVKTVSKTASSFLIELVVLFSQNYMPSVKGKRTSVNRNTFSVKGNTFSVKGKYTK